MYVCGSKCVCRSMTYMYTSGTNKQALFYITNTRSVYNMLIQTILAHTEQIKHPVFCISQQGSLCLSIMQSKLRRPITKQGHSLIMIQLVCTEWLPNGKQLAEPVCILNIPKSSTKTL